MCWNKDHPNCRAAFYRARRGDTSDNVLVVKVVDVMTAFLMVGSGRDGGNVVEAISVFGPREAGAGPFSSSSFSVFQTVSERVGGMLSQVPAGVSGVLSLLESYSLLFVSECSKCKRVLSVEGGQLNTLQNVLFTFSTGHVPPVDRIWDGSNWVKKHMTCR